MRRAAAVARRATLFVPPPRVAVGACAAQASRALYASRQRPAREPRLHPLTRPACARFPRRHGVGAGGRVSAAGARGAERARVRATDAPLACAARRRVHSASPATIAVHSPRLSLRDYSCFPCARHYFPRSIMAAAGASANWGQVYYAAPSTLSVTQNTMAYQFLNSNCIWYGVDTPGTSVWACTTFWGQNLATTNPLMSVLEEARTRGSHDKEP